MNLRVRLDVTKEEKEMQNAVVETLQKSKAREG